MSARLGLTLTADGGEIAVVSQNATKLFVCLFDAAGATETGRVELQRAADGVFRATLPGLKPGARYGLRAEGPYEPGRGHRFDKTKLLVDPYALEIDRPFTLHPQMSEFGADTGALAPKCVALAPTLAAPGKARISWENTVLYELNVAGISKLSDNIAPEARGRFAALGDPKLIEHFRALGVTTLELMPCDAFVDERHLPPLGLANAWGYNSVLWGCPDPRLAPGGWREVRAATDALHAAGLEVVLDVVLNHDGESDEFGATLSLRGLDNALYFRLLPDDPARYINDMGCGNCVALDRPEVVDMAVAALERWMVLGGIDGFRFDLATSLGRTATGFDVKAPLLAALAEHPALSHAKLIAEPWDIGPGGYRLGQFPASWGEWNDRFRDGARRFWRGDFSTRGELATRLAGSRDIFSGDAPPTKSVNYVAAHDGFTLADLVAFSQKHNEANGEDNRDGTNENYSWNHGVEGPTENAGINEWRRRDIRNLLALNIFSRGVPMLAMGSETGHSQRGNNNAYAQANEISWIDWRAERPEYSDFIGRCVALRRAHPSLRPLVWLKGEPPVGDDFADVEWRDATGPLTTGAHWEASPGDDFVAVFSATTSDGFERVALAFNRAAQSRSFTLPAPRPGFAWRFQLDTADDSRQDVASDLADLIALAPRSTALLVEERCDESRGRARPADHEQIEALAAAAGIAGDWWEVSGRHTVVSPQTKIALLGAMRLPARSAAQARESLSKLMDETLARKIPASVTLRLDAPRLAPLRSVPGEPMRDVECAITLEDGATLAGTATLGEGRRVTLADGREILEAELKLPELPIGRHRLEVDGVASLLTVAPPECFSSRAVWRRRFGLATQLYALRRGANDQGVGDFTALGVAGAGAGARGAAFLGVSPMHALFPSDRDRASPYHPSDRRFLDPLLIDVLADDGLQFDAAPFAKAFAPLAKLSDVDYPAVWALKREALRQRFQAFATARAARPGDPLFADYERFVAERGESLRRFAIFEAVSAEREGQAWQRWPTELRDTSPQALVDVETRLADDVGFAKFGQWLADRQLAAAAAKAGNGGLEIGLYRDLAVGSAPDGAEAWSRADELMQGVSVGAPPDPFSAQGQIWCLPAPDPVAGAREGWRGLAALYGANMRHAGMLRIDHAMGLTRLFVVPDGGKPADGAYIGFPADDLIGQIALESQRHRCAIVGEDLGTVPEGFRDKLTRAHIFGMRVLWFERDGAAVRDPVDYPALSVACASTHDLPTLAGWHRGADIGEKLTLGLRSLNDAQREIAERIAEKRELIAALRRSGALDAQSIDLDAEMTDALAAAFHAFIANSGSALAAAQFDDLAGEAIATNLPGTDRQRPNWRRRHPFDVETLLGRGRAKAILAAMGMGRR